MKKKIITAAEFDKLFDEGGDIRPYMDASSGRRPGLDTKRVNVDFPVWIIQKLDREAAKLGLARQALIKFFVAEKLGYDASGKK